MSGRLPRGFDGLPDPGELGRIAHELSMIAAQCAAFEPVADLAARARVPVSVPSVPAARRCSDAEIAERIRIYLVARRARAAILDGDWFADPAWDLLLDLLAAEHLGRRVSISSACIAASVPQTTALRWIDRLVAEGILVREDDPTDRRRSYLGLARDVAGRLEQWVERNLAPAPRPGQVAAA